MAASFFLGLLPLRDVAQDHMECVFAAERKGHGDDLDVNHAPIQADDLLLDWRHRLAQLAQAANALTDHVVKVRVKEVEGRLVQQLLRRLRSE